MDQDFLLGTGNFQQPTNSIKAKENGKAAKYNLKQLNTTEIYETKVHQWTHYITQQQTNATRHNLKEQRTGRLFYKMNADVTAFSKRKAYVNSVRAFYLQYLRSKNKYLVSTATSHVT